VSGLLLSDHKTRHPSAVACMTCAVLLHKALNAIFVSECPMPGVCCSTCGICFSVAVVWRVTGRLVRRRTEDLRRVQCDTAATTQICEVLQSSIIWVMMLNHRPSRAAMSHAVHCYDITHGHKPSGKLAPLPRVGYLTKLGSRCTRIVHSGHVPVVDHNQRTLYIGFQLDHVCMAGALL
jgi:hypothetical protein